MDEKPLFRPYGHAPVATGLLERLNGAERTGVEPDASSRNVTCGLFSEALGYKVVVAGTLAEALKMLDRLRVVFMAGCASDVSAPRGVLEEGVQFL